MVVKFQVFKKCTPNGKLTIYLTKRDFVEREDGVDNIEGVVLIDPSYVGNRNVYVVVVLNFRFGREEDESMGYNFVKTMNINTTMVYPPEKDIEPSEIQRNLCSKLGNFAFPFSLSFPALVTPSYHLQQGWEDSGAIMGVEYETMAFVGANENDIQTRSSARLMIRKLQDLPRSIIDSDPPKGVLNKTFLTCSGNLRIEAVLDKPVYVPEENINVSVNIKNDTTREAKRIKVKVVQLSEVPMFSNTQIRDKTLMKLDEGCPMPPGSSVSRNFTAMPGVPPTQSRGQVFLHGSLHSSEPPELAPSTILHNNVNKEDLFGVYVTYAVRVKVTMGPLTGDAVLDIPFVLTSPEVRGQESEVTPVVPQAQTPEVVLRPSRPGRQHMYHNHQYQQHRQQQYNMQQRQKMLTQQPQQQQQHHQPQQNQRQQMQIQRQQHQQAPSPQPSPSPAITNLSHFGGSPQLIPPLQ